MANEIKLSAEDAIDKIVGLCKPPDSLFCSGIQTAGETFKTALGDLADKEITIPIPEWVEDLMNDLDEWKKKAEELKKQLEDPLGGGSTPPLPAGDPLDPLRRLAEAINAAESKLNQQNLVIVGGTVDVSLTVSVGGADASANVKLSIQPKPFA